MNIDTMKSIALAVAAYKHNGNRYLKENVFDYYEGGQIISYTNKEIVRANLGVDHYSVDSKDRPPMLNVTQTDIDEAIKIKEYTKKNLLKLLALKPGDQPPYEVSLYQKLNQVEVQAGDLGYVASAPMYYYNNKKRDEINSRLEENKSQHVGTIGGKVSLENFEVTRNTWSDTYQGYVMQGLCEDNLYFFFTSHDVSKIKVGDTISLTGKVKAHLLEKDKYPMTKLNWVKIKGVDNATKNAARTNSHSDLF